MKPQAWQLLYLQTAFVWGLCLVGGGGAEDSWDMIKCVLVFKRKSSTNVLELLQHNYAVSVARILYSSKTYILFLQTVLFSFFEKLILARFGQKCKTEYLDLKGSFPWRRIKAYVGRRDIPLILNIGIRRRLVANITFRSQCPWGKKTPSTIE
jgi:hypothetical protein